MFFYFILRFINKRFYNNQSINKFNITKFVFKLLTNNFFYHFMIFF